MAKTNTAAATAAPSMEELEAQLEEARVNSLAAIDAELARIDKADRASVTAQEKRDERREELLGKRNEISPEDGITTLFGRAKRSVAKATAAKTRRPSYATRKTVNVNRAVKTGGSVLKVMGGAVLGFFIGLVLAYLISLLILHVWTLLAPIVWVFWIIFLLAGVIIGVLTATKERGEPQVP